MIATLWVALGGAIGSVGRYWAGILLESANRVLPWGTIIINIAGSFIIGFFLALTFLSAKYAVSENTRLFVMVGLCGGFTTFSSFSLQTFDLLKTGAIGRAFLNVFISAMLCVAATAVGYYWGDRLNDHGQASHHTVLVDEE